jgi:hypothetical protein
MAEAIAKAEAEGTLDNFEERGNHMRPHEAREVGIESILQRGLPEESTRIPIPNDTSSLESMRANILRGKHPMSLSQQTGDGRPRGGPNERRQETEDGGARGATTPAAARPRRTRPAKPPTASTGIAPNPRTSNPVTRPR